MHRIIVHIDPVTTASSETDYVLLSHGAQSEGRDSYDQGLVC